MPNVPLHRIESQVGETHRTVDGLHVEAGKVEEFARAVHDPAPVYRSVSAAQDAGHPTVPAPPTFTRTSYFPRYRPEGVDHSLGFELGFDPEYVLHGEQRYEYERPLYVGDKLYGESTLEDVFQRDGRQGGTMTFAVIRTDFYDADTDERVQTARLTRIETEGAVAEEAADGGEVTHSDGDTVAEVTDIERQDFVRYAGASGDFNPVHYDEPYATAAGHPSVFGQGMFSAGVASRAVRERFGLDGLASFRTRFTARVFPGDTLRVLLAENEEDESVDVEVVTDDGRTVVEGSATGRA